MQGMARGRRSTSSLSVRAKNLLRRTEGVDIEFKQSIAGLEASDISAFANSQKGGVILVGVAETKDAQGQQVGKIVGCDVGDKARLQILSKAMSCVPPVRVQVFVENVASMPFFRIEIPTGSDKPYSTNGGTYKIREDGRVRAINPPELLQILLDREAAVFQERFDKVIETVLEQLNRLASTISDTNKSIEKAVKEIGDTLEWTDMKVDDTESDISSTLDIARKLSRTTSDLQMRVMALIQHAGIPDPVKTEARKRLVKELAEKFRADPEIAKKITPETGFKITGRNVNLFSSDELSAIVVDALVGAGCEEILRGLNVQIKQ